MLLSVVFELRMLAFVMCFGEMQIFFFLTYMFVFIEEGFRLLKGSMLTCLHTSRILEPLFAVSDSAGHFIDLVVQGDNEVLLFRRAARFVR